MPKDVLYIGIHIRRTDYFDHIKWLVKGTVLDEKYFKKAMKVFKEKFRDKILIFVIASDDIGWCKKKFGDDKSVYFPDYRIEVSLCLFLIKSIKLSIYFGLFCFRMRKSIQHMIWDFYPNVIIPYLSKENIHNIILFFYSS